MPKKTAQDIAKAAKRQLGFERDKPPATNRGDATGQALERAMAASSGGKMTQKPATPGAPGKKQLAEKTAADKAMADQEYQKLIGQLNVEMDKYRRLREQQLKARRQEPEEEEYPPEMAEKMKAAKGKKVKKEVVIPSSKPSKGQAASRKARDRSSKSELSGMRRSG